MYKKMIFISLSILLVINGIVYFITKLNEQQRVEISLNDTLETLETHYNIILQHQKTIAITMFLSTMESKKFINIMKEAKGANQERRDELRVELQNFLMKKYERAKLKNVLQYQFIFPDNISFLRMHKPSKFGDDLTDIRDDVRYTNEMKKPIRSFTQGRTSHGFRNTFPIITKEGEYLGAMEISFSSDSFQYSLNNISQIHTHFLVSKKIFDTKIWRRDDLIVKYSQSAESSDFMVTLGTLHTKKRCIEDNIIKLAPKRKEIDVSLLSGEKFSFYVECETEIKIISFLPIKNLKDKSIAWLVSYEKAPFIELTLRGGMIIRIMTFLVSLLLIYFVIRQLHSRDEIERKHKLLNNILNITDNMVFITDFKTISFSNDRFKNLLNLKDTEELSDQVINLMVEQEGSLSSSLCDKNESFTSLIARTPEDARVVSILDRHLNLKSFKISISKTNLSDEFLVTLSDITLLKAKHDEIKKKAYYDVLTNVYNRNKFDEILEEEIYRASRYENDLTIAIIDIDKFKDFNDTYGHLIGDEVLIMVAQYINKNLRETDTFARWGGEEFVILFKNTSKEDASAVSDKLRDKISHLSHHSAGNVTVSFGITSYQKGDSLKSIFKRCDDALYVAKENGRNRVEVL